MTGTDMWSLMNTTKPALYAKFPTVRRFVDLGFDIDPRNHSDNIVALISLNQKIRLDLRTGDLAHA